jgi:cytochrome c556
LRATLDAARASPPLNCAGVGKVAQDVGAACKACHQDFRN